MDETRPMELHDVGGKIDGYGTREARVGSSGRGQATTGSAKDVGSRKDSDLTRTEGVQSRVYVDVPEVPEEKSQSHVDVDGMNASVSTSGAESEDMLPTRDCTMSRLNRRCVIT